MLLKYMGFFLVLLLLTGLSFFGTLYFLDGPAPQRVDNSGWTKLNPCDFEPLKHNPCKNGPRHVKRKGALYIPFLLTGQVEKVVVRVKYGFSKRVSIGLRTTKGKSLGSRIFKGTGGKWDQVEIDASKLKNIGPYHLYFWFGDGSKTQTINAIEIKQESNISFNYLIQK